MTTPKPAALMLLKVAPSKFALKTWASGGRQWLWGDIWAVLGGLSWADWNSCRNHPAREPIRCNRCDGLPRWIAFLRFHRNQAMHINNSALSSTCTCKNLANRSVKSAGGGKAVGLNVALSLHTHSSSGQPQTACRGSSFWVWQLLQRADCTTWRGRSETIVGSPSLQALQAKCFTLLGTRSCQSPLQNDF